MTLLCLHYTELKILKRTPFITILQIQTNPVWVPKNLLKQNPEHQ